MKRAQKPNAEPAENLLSQEKFDELKSELERLTTVTRKEIAESLEYARSLGDLSENAEYQAARELQAATEEPRSASAASSTSLSRPPSFRRGRRERSVSVPP